MTVDTLEHAPPIIASAGFAPSRFQQDIFDYVRDGEGDIFVGAVAGSGKTTTLCRIADLLTPSQQRNAAFVAFNRHVVAELKERLPEDFTVRTIHSMGFAALGKYYRWKGGNPVDDKKYRRIAKEYIQDLLMGRPEAEFSESELIDNMVRLCSLVRLTLTQPRYEMARDPYLPLWLLCNRFNIEVLDVEAMSVGIEHMLEEGLRQADRRIDMDDMVYLAAKIPDLRPSKFDTIMVDECQDLNAAQRTFLLRLRGGRAFWVGDERQAIYGFAGADINSVREIAQVTGAKSLPLSICYRCPESHVRLAQQIVPSIEWRPGAPKGEISSLYREDVVRSMCDRNRSREDRGPLVLCRTTQPLIDMCFELIRGGVPATVKGRDIGKQLTQVIVNVSKLKGYSYEYFGPMLNEWSDKRIKLLARKDQEAQIQSLRDKVACIHLIHENACDEGIMDTDELVDYAQGMFGDGGGHDLPTLSTVHKAKGLEADNVFILKPELMPHPMARQDHEIEQEWNIRYIALTRSKKSLTFIRTEGA